MIYMNVNHTLKKIFFLLSFLSPSVQHGKRQSRRVAITSDGRSLLISLERDGMRSLLKKRSVLRESSDSFKKIEISSIDRIVRGQLTRKFLTK